jgi:hypothetical protein
MTHVLGVHTFYAGLEYNTSNYRWLINVLKVRKIRSSISIIKFEGQKSFRLPRKSILLWLKMKATLKPAKPLNLPKKLYLLNRFLTWIR